MTTKIEWCMNPDGTPGEVWNPVTGCRKTSSGCQNCYAERIAKRFWGERKFTDVVCHEDRLDVPLHWKKPRRIFVNSMSDLFHPNVPFGFVEGVWDTIAKAQQHTFIILTKRPDRMLKFSRWMAGRDDISTAEWPRNVWLGVSVENQQAADERIPLLLQTPAAVRFLSCEPLLGPVELDHWLKVCKHWNIKDSLSQAPWHPPYPKYQYSPQALVHADWEPPIHWVIAGGESGPGARPAHPDWFRGLRDQCQAASVPFFFKQWGEWAPPEVDRYGPSDVLPLDGSCTSRHHCFAFPDGQRMERIGKGFAGRLLDGREWNEFPEPRT
jgi:protein gp37